MRWVFVAFLVLVSIKVEAQEAQFYEDLQKIESAYRLLRSPKKLGELKMTSTLLIGFKREIKSSDFHVASNKRETPCGSPICKLTIRETFLEKKVWKIKY